jgi:hypothetical protein
VISAWSKTTHRSLDNIIRIAVSKHVFDPSRGDHFFNQNFLCGRFRNTDTLDPVSSELIGAMTANNLLDDVGAELLLGQVADHAAELKNDGFGQLWFPKIHCDRSAPTGLSS